MNLRGNFNWYYWKVVTLVWNESISSKIDAFSRKRTTKYFKKISVFITIRSLCLIVVWLMLLLLLLLLSSSSSSRLWTWLFTFQWSRSWSNRRCYRKQYDRKCMNVVKRSYLHSKQTNSVQLEDVLWSILRWGWCYWLHDLWNYLS